MRWVFKVIAKLLIARLPVSYAFWKSIGVFRHGRMDSMDYPIKIFNMHLSRAFPLGLPAGSVILELGPGDSVASAVLGFVNGAHCTYLVDVGDFARKDVAFYHQLAMEMTGRGSCAPEFSIATSFEEILQICNAQYLIEGISSLHQIPSGSVDFIWSHSVLEHVRKHELRTLLCELRRILKPGAFSSHNIDYQDHLDFSLNNMRFSEKLWESPFFAKSGFYTNRVPAVKMHTMFREAGFEILQEAFGKWLMLPISRKSIHHEFKTFRDNELINRTSHVLMKI